MKKATMLMFALMVGLSFATMTFADEKKVETKTEKKSETKDGKTTKSEKTEKTEKTEKK